MRFMLLMIPKGYETAAPGTAPDAKAVAAMMKFNESLQKAGVHTQTACDFHVEGIDDLGTGHGVFEFLLLGAYAPYGFKSFGDVAK